jgi:hypothetical protein
VAVVDNICSTNAKGLKHFGPKPCAITSYRKRVFTHVKTTRCVSRSINRRVREIIEWSGGASSRPTPKKLRNAYESAARQAMPRSASDALEIADQQQPKIDPRRQSGPAHRLRIKAGALRLDEIIEAVLSQQLMQPLIEGMTCSDRGL